MLHFSLFFSTGLGAMLSNTGFSIAIAILALILGAEIAGIAILISKMMRARHKRYAREYEEEEETRGSSYHAASLLLLFGAVPQSTYLVLSVLSILTAVFAVVFLLLLIIFRAKGYDFASSSWYQEAESRRSRVEEEKPAEALPEEPTPAEDEREEEVALALDEETVHVSDADDAIDEEQSQDAYTEAVEAETDPTDIFAEESDSDALPPEDESTAPVEVAHEDDAAPVGMVETAVAPADGAPTLADGSQPYKIVEKYVTETYKEIVTQTPAPAPAPASSNDAVIEKLTDILDALQKQNEREDATEDVKAGDSRRENDRVNGGAMPTTYVGSESDEDEDDEDEDDLTESVEKSDDEDDDRDTEEDDTDGDHFTGNERIIGFDEKTGCYIVAHYRKSFEAKLIQARPEIKKYYSELKNALLSYKGTKNRISWTADSFHNGRMPIAKINVKTRILELYLALDPASLEGTVYRGRDVGSKKKYADTPFQYKLRTPRKFKWALELIQRTCEEHGLTPIDIDPVDYEQQYPFDSTENLVARNLIKEYIREEKPATSFELAPDHTPAVPKEDDSVIPANANFSWEFDNDAMQEKEPEPIPAEPEVEETPEPIPEPTPAPAPTPAPEAPAATVTRETVKVTEMRYTERYYANADPIYERVVTTTEPIEAEAIPAAEELMADAQISTEESIAETAADEIVVTESESDALTLVAEKTAQEDTDAEESVDIWDGLVSNTTVREDVDADDASAEYEYPEEDETAEDAEDFEEDGERFFDDPAEDDSFADAHDAFGESEWDDAEYPAEAEEALEETEEDEGSESAEEYGEENDSFGEYAKDCEDSESAYYEDEIEEEYRPASVEVVETVEEEPEPEPKRYVIRNPELAVVDIASLEEHFPNGALINLESLKALELVLPSAKKLKIYTSSDTLTKAFTVEANQFTQSAFIAISTANGRGIVIL